MSTDGKNWTGRKIIWPRAPSLHLRNQWLNWAKMHAGNEMKDEIACTYKYSNNIVFCSMYLARTQSTLDYKQNIHLHPESSTLMDLCKTCTFIIFICN